ncbi:MAG: hypothetical protein ACTHNU_12590 [Gaiellales bacterium]
MPLGSVRRAAAERLRAWTRPLAAPSMRMLLRWERLEAHTQIVIAFPTLVVVFFLIHLTLFLQPVGRSVFYGFFYAILGTFAVVVASRTEAAKRARRARGEPDEEDDEH